MPQRAFQQVLFISLTPRSDAVLKPELLAKACPSVSAESQQRFNWNRIEPLFCGRYYVSVILPFMLVFHRGRWGGPAILPGAEVRARACRGESGSPKMGSKRDPLKLFFSLDQKKVLGFRGLFSCLASTEEARLPL